LEDNVSDVNPIEHDSLIKKYEEYNKSFNPNNQIPQVLLDAGSEILDDFYDLYGGTTFNVHEKELGFSFVLGNYSINGFIDRVDINGDVVEIVDYKTGKREVAAKDIHKNLQLGIYALAASRMFPGSKIKASLHYLRSGRIKSHEYTEEDLELAKQSLVDRINQIMNDTNFSPTKNERVCSFCDHAQSGACSTGAIRLRKFNRA
jgi:RecB family exonuclease